MEQLLYAIVTMIAGWRAAPPILPCRISCSISRCRRADPMPRPRPQHAPRRAHPPLAVSRPGAHRADALSHLSVIESLRLSFHGKDGQQFVGLYNYILDVWRHAVPRVDSSNNFLWLLVVPALSTIFGLVIAVLTDRIWWGNIAKSLIFMPMAISFVGAAVIWKFVYDYRERRLRADRHPQRLHRLARLSAAGLDHHSLLEQLLPDGDPHLDPDRLRHGHPVGGAARHSRRDDRSGGHRRRQRLPDLLQDHGAANLGHIAVSDDDHHPRAQGRRSPSSCSKCSTSCSP